MSGSNLMAWAMVAMLACMGGTAWSAPTDLLRTIPSPHADKYWGVALAPGPGSTVLVSSTGGWMGGSDTPIHLVDVLNGQTIRTYAEPGLPAYSGSDLFGSSMTVVGDYVLVGAYSKVGSWSQAGCVHVYDLSDGSYLRTIDHPHPTGSGSFGLSMATLGDLAVIGTYADSGSSGAAYIVNPSTGAVVQRLLRPTGSTTQDFGCEVAVLGDEVLVSGRSSAAYRLDADNGAVKAVYADPGAGGLFGYSIAAAGDKVLVGAFKANNPVSESGVVHVFDADNGNLLHTILNPFPAGGDWFGIDIAVWDDRYAVIGAANDNGLFGQAFLFDLNDYSLIGTYLNPTPATGERYGENVAWVGNMMVTSAWRDAGDKGAVYVYEGIPEPTTLSCIVLGGLGLLGCVRRRRR